MTQNFPSVWQFHWLDIFICYILDKLVNYIICSLIFYQAFIGHLYSLLMGCQQSSEIIIPGQNPQFQSSNTLRKSEHNGSLNPKTTQMQIQSNNISTLAKINKENFIQKQEKRDQDSSKIIRNEKQIQGEAQDQDAIIVDPHQIQPFIKFKISNQPTDEMTININQPIGTSYKVNSKFQKMSQKLIKGLSTQRNNQTKQNILFIDPSDCNDNLCIVSLFDGNNCYTSGQYNSNNWWTERGTIAGIQAYQIHPPKSLPKYCLNSRHCIAFHLPQNKNYSIYKLENHRLTQVSETISEKIKDHGWNLFTNLVVSECEVSTVYFAYPLDLKLPSQLACKIQQNKKQKLSLEIKYQKLLIGSFSKQSQKNNPISPIIKAADCIDDFGVICLEDQYTHYCNTNGDHNANNWIVQKLILAGINVYRVHPPLLKVKKFFGSKHCVSFYLNSKQDYNIFALQKGKISQISYISSEDVKENDWNMQKSLVISELDSPVIYFAYPTKKKLPYPLAPQEKKNEDGYYFDTYCRKNLAGKYSVEQENHQSKKPIFKQEDCLDKFGVISLKDDGNNCHTGGQYNSNNWIVQKGVIIGIQAYRVQPPKSKPTENLCSRHGIIFNLPEKKDYCFYKIQNDIFIQVSYLPAQVVKPKEWNIINNVTISQLKSSVIYFALPLDNTLPAQLILNPKAQAKEGRVKFIKKCQKLLSGEFSKESQISNPISPIIKTQDCFEGIGVVSLLIENSKYCSCNGEDNYNNWIIQYGTLSGIDAYKIYPPLSKPKKGLASKHCVSFFLNSKEDFDVFKVERGRIYQVSFISASQVRLNDWNLQPSLSVSQITCPVIYFIYPKTLKLPTELKTKSIQIKDKFYFKPYCQKVLTGQFSKQFENQQSKQPQIKSSDSLLNFGIISLSDGNYCHLNGHYNSSYWTVQKGQLYGIQVYRLHPPKFPPVKCFGSKHCITFKLSAQKEYCFYKISSQKITQVSYLPAQQVKQNSWNMIKNILVSQLKNPAIYFVYPFGEKLPRQLTPDILPTKLQFLFKYQKILTGQSSKERQNSKITTPLIKNPDCFVNFGIMSLLDESLTNCYTSGDYNCRNYIVEKGLLGGLEAYRIHPPLDKPKEALSSRHCIGFLFQEKANYRVYRVKENGTWTQIYSIPPDEVKVAQYNFCKNFAISQITQPLILIATKQSLLGRLASLKEQYQPYNIMRYKQRFFSNKQKAKLPFAKLLQFQKEDQILLSEKFSRQKPKNGLPSPLILPPDCFQSIGIICLPNENNDTAICGQWNSNNWIIEKGHIEGTLAYRIQPPEHFPSSTFATFQHCITLNFPTKQKYFISKIIEGFNVKVQEISDSQIIPNKPIILKKIKISELKSPLTLLIQKYSNPLSSYTLKNSVQAAVIYQDQQISIANHLIKLPECPLTPQMFNYSPAVWQCVYPKNRRYYVFYSQNKEIIVWSNHDDSVITMTQFDYENFNVKNIRLFCKEDRILGSAVGDDKHLYYTIVYPHKAGNAHWTVQMCIIKANIKNGQVERQVKLPTDKDNLNIYKIQTSHMAISGKFLGLFLSRTETQAEDKINHQSSHVAVIDTETLQIVFQSKVSSHSFGNSLIVRKDGRFCGIDQGDNWPRGINYYLFDNKSYSNKVVYSYKTYHGTTEKNPSGNFFPLYQEISTPEKKFYQWSNDNSTYSQIAAPGIHQAEDGFYIFFAGQNLPNPLDSTIVNQNGPGCLFGTRNLGYVKTRKEICQDLSQYILTKGPTYKSSYYQFGGGLIKQEVTGVQWITNLTNGQNISRLKTCMIKNKILLIYEIWNKDSHIRTEYMILNLANGKYTAPKVLPCLIRLYRSGDIFLKRDSQSETAVIYCGDQFNTFNRFEISLIQQN